MLETAFSFSLSLFLGSVRDTSRSPTKRHSPCDHAVPLSHLQKRCGAGRERPRRLPQKPHLGANRGEVLYYIYWKHVNVLIILIVRSCNARRKNVVLPVLNTRSHSHSSLTLHVDQSDHVYLSQLHSYMRLSEAFRNKKEK